ncbi:MAG: hypothetical protein KTR29_14265 [Rhodothermaceae bacterium]|nr:hypothetical protein [Rhodothermaceae bacterium]
MKAILEATSSSQQRCKELEEALNAAIQKECASKAFEQSKGGCAPSVSPTTPVDLVIVIDTSGSMSDEATQLSAAADAAISAAQKSCPSDLKVAWFGIEGTWPGTNFDTTYRNYLTGLGIPDASLVGIPGDTEEGAAAIIDLANHYDWRPGASRKVFYLGDEGLLGGNPDNADDEIAANTAIATANRQGVNVYTYFGTQHSRDSTGPARAEIYERVANQTGGEAFEAPVSNMGGFQVVLEKVICATVGATCQPVEEPTLVPCIKLKWGDGPKDCLETDDVEVICITVCNPYSNVTLKDFMLHLTVTDAVGGPVPMLPDGTPSVFIKPDYMICFGDIPPCDPASGESSCVSREAVLVSRGAAEGNYQVFTAHCFEASFTKIDFGTTFDLELVRS